MTTLKRKTADTNRTSTTTLAADPDLTVDLEAGKRYLIEGCVQIYADTAPDFKFAWDFAGTLNEACGYMLYHDVRAIFTYSTSINARPVGPGFLTGAAAIVLPGSGTTTHRAVVWLRAVVDVATAGAFALWWAQNTSSGAACKVLTGSWLVAEEG